MKVKVGGHTVEAIKVEGGSIYSGRTTGCIMVLVCKGCSQF